MHRLLLIACKVVKIVAFFACVLRAYAPGDHVFILERIIKDMLDYPEILYAARGGDMRPRSGAGVKNISDHDMLFVNIRYADVTVYGIKDILFE